MNLLFFNFQDTLKEVDEIIIISVEVLFELFQNLAGNDDEIAMEQIRLFDELGGYEPAVNY